MKQKGWIALDIDGTITLDKYSVPQPVIDYLGSLSRSGWRVALATGRPYAFASMALSKFDFPYIFLAQNGSAALEMPGAKPLFKNYLSPSVLRTVEEAYEGIDSDFVVYAGYEKGDYCYWRPQRLSKEDLEYLGDLQKRQKEIWRAVESYETIEDDFPLIKCFGPAPRMKKVADRLSASGLFQVAAIRDPFHENYQILLVTEKSVSKGDALKKIFARMGRGEKVITAGDDENDMSLFQVADIKIAMSHAPERLKEKADLIAPPTQDCGIIHALEMVLNANR